MKNQAPFTIRALIGKLRNPSSEEYTWMARALEVNISGFGATEEDAWNNLCRLIGAQIRFADLLDAPEILDHPAEEGLFLLWTHLQSVLGEQDASFQDINRPARIPSVIDSSRMRQGTIEAQYALA